MRLTGEQIASIRQAAKGDFGLKTRETLFGFGVDGGSAVSGRLGGRQA